MATYRRIGASVSTRGVLSTRRLLREFAIARMTGSLRKAAALTKKHDPAMPRTPTIDLAENDEHEDAIIAYEKALKLIEKKKQPDSQLKADLVRALKRYNKASGNQ